MSKKNRTTEQKRSSVIANHATIVKEARRKHEAGEALNGAERYIIKNNIGFHPMMED